MPWRAGECFDVYCEHRFATRYRDALIRSPQNIEDLRRLLATCVNESLDSRKPMLRSEGAENASPVSLVPPQRHFLARRPYPNDCSYLVLVGTRRADPSWGLRPT